MKTECNNLDEEQYQTTLEKATIFAELLKKQ